MPAQGIQTACDARLNALLPSLTALQDAYFVIHGQYFQGLTTHETTPHNGADTPADRLNSKPTDQEESWNDFGFSPGNTPFSLSVDIHHGPGGKGWSCRMVIEFNGETFQRVTGFREMAWSKRE